MTIHSGWAIVCDLPFDAGALTEVVLMRRNRKPRMRDLVVAIASLFAACQHAAAKDEYPTQTIKIVVPFVAGGGVDIVARLVAPKLSEALG